MACGFIKNPSFSAELYISIGVPIVRFVLQENMTFSYQLKLIRNIFFQEAENPSARLSGDSGKITCKRYFLKR
jgi:hypothetical protein